MDSFASQVKEELEGRLAPDIQGMIAELTGIVSAVALDAMPAVAVRKLCVLVNRIFHVEWETVCTQQKLPGGRVRLHFTDAEFASRMMQRARQFKKTEKQTDEQSFLRGVFLSSGSISDPRKDYHCEIFGTDPDFLENVAERMLRFGVEMHFTRRNRNDRIIYVLYLKDGEQLVDFLNVLQAYTALMELENIRIEKEMRNQLNRTTNFEVANSNKMVAASVKQIRDIHYLVDQLGWNGIPDSLAQMARIRLDHPEESLSELGAYFQPPIGRSGVNHRLRRITELAEGLRADRNVSTKK